MRSTDRLAILSLAGMMLMGGLVLRGDIADPWIASADGSGHPPILIDGDLNFTTENGVVGGNGTLADPYLIDGWEIIPENAAGIHIRNTTAHFDINAVSLVGPGFVADEQDQPGILLENVSHGHVVNVTIQRVSSGIIVNSSSSVRVSSSEISLTRLRMAEFDSGIRIESSVNITITDNFIYDTKFGIYVVGSADLNVSGNDSLFAGPGTMIDSSHNIEFSGNVVVCDCANRDALVIQFSSNLSLARNKIFHNRVGIVFFYTQNATLDANNITDNHLDGLALRWSRNFTLTRNIFAADGIYLYGDAVEDYTSHNISGDNLVNGRPVLAYNGCSDLLIDGANAGQVIVTNCTGAHIRNLTIENTDHAILLAFTEGGNVTGNQVTDTRHGVDVLSSSSVTVSQNVITGSWQGITVETSDGVVLRGNQLLSGHEGFRAGSSTNLQIESNEIRSNEWGGVVQNSSHILFIGNEVADTERVGLNYYNDVTNATAYHNNFTGSFPQVLDGGSNRWDDGYPSGGNQWLDYSGVDQCSGPNQDVCPDPDGIGDTPYVIDADSGDRYPLTPPTPPDVEFRILDENFQEVSSLVEKVVYFFDGSDTADNLDSVQNMTFEWDFGDGNATTGINVTFVYDRFGDYNVVLTVTDRAGNEGNATRGVVVGVNPATRPDLEIEPHILEIDPESPEESTPFRMVSVTIRLSVTNTPDRARANSVQVSFFAFQLGQSPGDPVPITPVFHEVSGAITDNTLDPGAKKTIEFTWITGSRGSYTLRVNVTDPEEPDLFIGPRNSAERTIFVRAAPPQDTAEPTIAITSPADGSTLASTFVTVFGTASDDVALDRVEGSADGVNWVLATGGMSWFLILNLTEGEHSIFARATDTSGNVAMVSIVVTVVTSPPSLPISPLVIAGVGAGAAAVASLATLLILRSRGKRKGED